MNFKDEPEQSQLALDQLGWKSLEERRKHIMARLMFNQVVNNLAPSRFSSMFQNSNHIHSYNLRGSNSSHSFFATTIPSMAENISDIVGLKSDHCMLTTVY
jgi:hypothetical protein